MHALKDQEPFAFRSLPGTLFQTALQQPCASERPHIRTLDRLHLAAMEALEIRPLMTHDQAQAQVAATLGYDVVSPV